MKTGGDCNQRWVASNSQDTTTISLVPHLVGWDFGGYWLVSWFPWGSQCSIDWWDHFGPFIGVNLLASLFALLSTMAVNPLSLIIVNKFWGPDKPPLPVLPQVNLPHWPPQAGYTFTFQHGGSITPLLSFPQGIPRPCQPWGNCLPGSLQVITQVGTLTCLLTHQTPRVFQGTGSSILFWQSLTITPSSPPSSLSSGNRLFQNCLGLGSEVLHCAE